MVEKEKDLVNAVIEIDEVEYLIDRTAAEKIVRKEEVIPLMRLIDHEVRTIPLENILKIVQEIGITDRIGG